MIIIIIIAVVLLQNNQSRSLCNWTNNLIKFFTIDKFCTRNLQSIWHAAYLSFLFSIALVDLKASSNCCLSCLFFLSSLEITLIRLLTNSSCMQCTQKLWLHALSTRKNWIAQFNWINGKKMRNDCFHIVNARFTQGLIKIAFSFLWLKISK